MGILIGIIGAISLGFGLLSGYWYLTHPLAFSEFATYRGKGFWIVSFICAIVLYLKG